ncbi:MAG TPA: DNA gyrase inhibitor YacG [Burkholderiales bacterium]|nr:DNA gyrase inhibitor YacG [Burkholderiales bacterium]
MQPVRTVPCPRCGRPAVFDREQNKWRPFCSERCKLIDLGDWAAERYRVPLQEEPETSSEDPKEEP